MRSDMRTLRPLAAIAVVLLAGVALATPVLASDIVDSPFAGPIESGPVSATALSDCLPIMVFGNEVCLF